MSSSLSSLTYIFSLMKHLFCRDYTINGGSDFVWQMWKRGVFMLFLYTRIWPFLRMWRPLTLARCCACLTLLISSSTLHDASLRFAQSPAVSPIWWQRSSIQAMPARGGRLTSLDASFARCFAFWRTSSKTSTSMFFQKHRQNIASLRKKHDVLHDVLGFKNYTQSYDKSVVTVQNWIVFTYLKYTTYVCKSLLSFSHLKKMGSFPEFNQSFGKHR